ILDMLSGNNIDLVEPALSILPPVGGKQIYRSLSFLQDAGVVPKVNINANTGISGGINEFPASYSKKDGLRYTMDLNDPMNLLKGLVYGSNTTNEGREYFDNGNKPLNEKNTAEIQNAFSQFGTDPNQYLNYKREAGKVGGKKDENGETIDGSKKNEQMNMIESAGMNDIQKYGMYYNEMFTEKEREAVDAAVVNGVKKEDIVNMYHDIKTMEIPHDTSGKAVTNAAAVLAKQAIDEYKLTDAQKKKMYEVFGIGKEVASGKVTQGDITRTIEEQQVLAAAVPEKTYKAFDDMDWDYKGASTDKNKWISANCNTDAQKAAMYSYYMEDKDTDERDTIKYAQEQGVTP
ncbi:MAG: hypothetical protein RR389_08525, partial [Christensenella sp.]